MHFRATRILALALLSSACGLAVGAAKQAQFNVTATVVSNCFIDSASAMAFGAAYNGSADIDQTSTIEVRCTNGIPYGIGLDAGSGAGSTLTQRTMTSATAVGSTLQYNLFTDSNRSIVWVNPSNTTSVVGNQAGSGSGLGTVKTHTVYGRLQNTATSQSAAPASDYTSTITITINY